jgi:enoyl-CoA hydratase/carnithine racemase
VERNGRVQSPDAGRTDARPRSERSRHCGGAEGRASPVSPALLGLGEGFSADRALAAGLIYRVVPEADLEAEALALAATLATRPPEALKIARDLMLGNRETLVARIEEEGRHFRARLRSDEAREAFMAFMGRKKG